MSAPTCTHGMPTPAACVTCMEDGVMVPAKQPKALRVFKAQYRGTCDRCEGGIEPGEEIALLDTDEYVHAVHLPNGGRP